MVLSMKLAEASVAGEVLGEHPVMLLDDVLSELDDARQTYLLTRIEDKQTFVTTCDSAAFARTNGKLVLWTTEPCGRVEVLLYGGFCSLFEKREPEKTFNRLYNNRKLKVKRSLKISADECKVQNENIAKIDAMRK